MYKIKIKKISYYYTAELYKRFLWMYWLISDFTSLHELKVIQQARSWKSKYNIESKNIFKLYKTNLWK